MRRDTATLLLGSRQTFQRINVFENTWLSERLRLIQPANPNHTGLLIQWAASVMLLRRPIQATALHTALTAETY